MKSQENEIDDSRVSGLLEKLRPAPDRNPAAAASRRAAFLAQAQSLAPAVSVQNEARHKKWNPLFLFRKEPRKMTVIATIMIILALMFGGTGATVAAAQGSAPDEPLYSVKIASEDWRLALANNVQTRLALNMQYANRRVDEMAGMLQTGQGDLLPVQSRWERHVQTALQLAAQGSDEQLKNQLGAILLQLKAQEQVMNQAGAGAPPDMTPLKEQLQSRIREQLQTCADGLADPQQFRNRERVRQRIEPTATSDENETSGETQTEDVIPGSGYGKDQGGNPWTTGTPTPGSGYGPGPGPGITCTPNPGNAPGPAEGQPGGQTNPPEDKGGSPGGQGGSGKGK